MLKSNRDSIWPCATIGYCDHVNDVKFFENKDRATNSTGEHFSLPWKMFQLSNLVFLKSVSTSTILAFSGTYCYVLVI